MEAPPREPQWHEREKISLLAEIVKTHTDHPGFLLNVLNNMPIASIRWDDVILPPGRTVSSCRFALDELRRQYSTYPSQSPPGPYTPQLGHASSLKRQLPPEGVAGPAGTYQPIRPKPPSASGPYGQPATNEPPAKRKRGRPPKAVAQQRQEQRAREAAAMASATQTPPVPQIPTATQSLPIPPPRLEESRPEVPPQPQLPRMPISAVLTPAPKSASQSSSSSGKRRRGRTSRSDFGGPLRDAPQSAQDYGSPLSRRDTAPVVPAEAAPRTTTFRPRDESGPESTMTYPQASPFQPATTRPPDPSPRQGGL